MGKRKFSKEVKEAHERLVKTFENLDLEGITILTGSNGSGKSLIRKQLPFLMRDHLELDDANDTRGMIRSTSMDARTSSNPEWSALSGAMRDVEWIATSQNTFHSLEGLFNSVDNKVKYIIIDEFEIGCGEETILAIVNFLNKNLKKFMRRKNFMGAMIITHSRIGVENLNHDHFINIEGMTKDEWLNREIIPIDLEKLSENELFSYIKDQQ